MDDALRALQEISDPKGRAKRASEMSVQYQTVVTEISRIRREALEELIENGMTQSEIGELLGIARSRVGQLLSAGPRPERAFLGSGSLTVAIGGKLEANKEKPGAVASKEAFAAYEKLAALGRTLGLEAKCEIVPPPGFIQLNRANLLVMCSPRLLPFVGQVLESDTNLGFSNDADGWYLVDKKTGENYRSPQDSGKPCDYAYIGKLPRPDGRGTFLYLAGIHAMGTLGAAKYLEDHLEELYRGVRKKRFSMLVECHYDADSHELTSTSALTPIYRHEGV